MSLPDHIPPLSLTRAEEATTRYYLRATMGTTVEHVLEPDYWVHVTGRMLRSPNKGIGDEIRVVAEDGSFDMEVTVISIDARGLWAQVRPIRVWKAKEVLVRPPDNEGYTVEFSGPHKWRILNRAGDVVAKDFPDEAAAMVALTNIKSAKRKAA